MSIFFTFFHQKPRKFYNLLIMKELKFTNDLEKVKKVYKLIMGELQLSQKQLADLIGYNASVVSGILKGKRKLSDEFTKSLYEISKNNLLLEDEPLNNEVNYDYKIHPNIPLSQFDFKMIIPSDLYERLDCDIDEYMKTNISNMRSSATIKQFAPFSYFFEVMGDAMAPYFLPSDMLALKIQPHPFKVENGRVYVIDTRGGVIVRMLYRNGDDFLAKAFNPRFTELPILSSDVYDIYKVVGLVRRNI